MLKNAADLISANPTALQLRYLQTMSDMSTEQNTKTIFFPLPIDLLETMKTLANK